MMTSTITHHSFLISFDFISFALIGREVKFVEKIKPRSTCGAFETVEDEWELVGGRGEKGASDFLLVRN